MQRPGWKYQWWWLRCRMQDMTNRTLTSFQSKAKSCTHNTMHVSVVHPSGGATANSTAPRARPLQLRIQWLKKQNKNIVCETRLWLATACKYLFFFLSILCFHYFSARGFLTVGRFFQFFLHTLASCTHVHWLLSLQHEKLILLHKHSAFWYFQHSTQFFRPIPWRQHDYSFLFVDSGLRYLLVRT